MVSLRQAQIRQRVSGFRYKLKLIELIMLVYGTRDKMMDGKNAPIEQYVPCKNGGCNMSAKFKTGGFKVDIEDVLRKLTGKRRKTLQQKFDIWNKPGSGIDGR